MHRQTSVTRISTSESALEGESGSRPFSVLLLGFGLIATAAVALLALNAMVNPAFAQSLSNVPTAEYRLIET